MRYSGVDLLKHLLAIAVLWIHVRSESRYSQSTNDLILRSGDYVDGAVMGFFMISGFFSRPQASLSWPVVSKAFKKNFVRIMVPFFLFSILYAFMLAFLGKGKISGGLRSTINLQGASMQLYFLPELFGIVTAFNLVTGFTSHIGRNVNLILGGLMACLVLLSLSYPTSHSTGNGLRLVPLYGACYIIGYFIQVLFGLRSRYHAGLALIVVSASIIGCFDKRFWDLALIVALLALALFVSSLDILKNRNIRGSGGVYLLHVPIVMYAVSSLLLKLGVGQMANALLSVLVTFAVCLGATIAFCGLFKKASFLILE